jgi:hypothetical protein
MSELLEIEDRITEEQFEKNIWGKNLTVAERECLRRYYGLPCNETLISLITNWRNYAVMAFQKIKGNPLL